MKLLPAIVAAVLLAGHDALPAAPQDRPPEFVLGVLRADGLVSPFATFDGRRWRSRWPDRVRNIDLPISLEDVPENWWGVEPPPKAMTISSWAGASGMVNSIVRKWARLPFFPASLWVIGMVSAVPAPARLLVNGKKESPPAAMRKTLPKCSV